MSFRCATKILLALGLALPVVQAVLVWVAALLTGMGDAAGAAIVGHVGTACQVVWSVALIGLVLVLALIVLNEEPQHLSSKPEEPFED